MLQRIGWLRVSYWLYLGVGALALFVVSVIEDEVGLTALSAVVIALAVWRLITLARDPDN